MEKILCIYHGNCADGFGAAWAVRHAYGAENVEFHAGVYGDPPPDVSGRGVILVDFSYKRPVLIEMAQRAKWLRIIDHHKTAAEDLRELHFEPALDGCAVEILFDMERSGAGLAWDVLHPGVSRPALIDHIEDRDLWRFKLEGTREIQANLFSYPYDFDVWDRLMNTDPRELRREGAAIERKHVKDIAELLAVTKRPMRIGGYDVLVANLPYTLASDAGNALAKEAPFGATYYDTAEHRIFSLRSIGDFDVSAIAKAYGGGGHRNAAGFRMPRGWEGDAPETAA